MDLPARHVEYLRLILESGERTLFRMKVDDYVVWCIQAQDGHTICSDFELQTCIDKFIYLHFNCEKALTN
jgi:hypothetical protein